MTKAEQYIKDQTRHCSNELCYEGLYESWLTPDQALAAVEISKKDLIDKACEWLNNFYNDETNSYLITEDIEAFVKAMEE